MLQRRQHAQLLTNKGPPQPNGPLISAPGNAAAGGRRHGRCFFFEMDKKSRKREKPGASHALLGMSIFGSQGDMDAGFECGRIYLRQHCSIVRSSD